MYTFVIYFDKNIKNPAADCEEEEFFALPLCIDTPQGE